jgi:hypothetical protein
MIQIRSSSQKFSHLTSIHFKLNEWYHFILTVSHKLVSFYVDGKLFDQVQIPFTFKFGGTTLKGRIANSLSESPLICIVSSIYLFSSCLGEEEIKLLSDCQLILFMDFPLHIDHYVLLYLRIQCMINLNTTLFFVLTPEWQLILT